MRDKKLGYHQVGSDDLSQRAPAFRAALQPYIKLNPVMLLSWGNGKDKCLPLCH